MRLSEPRANLDLAREPPATSRDKRIQSGRGVVRVNKTVAPMAIGWMALVACVGGLTAQQPATLALTYSARALVAGEAMLVTVSAPEALASVEGTAFDHPVRFAARGGNARHWQGLAAIPLGTKAGRYTMAARATTVNGTALETRRRLTVTGKTFRVSRITVAREFLEPPESERQRIADEAQLMADRLARVSPEVLWQGRFVIPVDGPVSSEFGVRRVVNGEARNRHLGVDLAAKTGTPVVTPNQGRVVLVGSFYYSGNTVLVDHGLGVFSLFAHLSQTLVAEGDLVERGREVGRVGATGRVTAPHLHWTVKVGEVNVDPMSLVALITRPGP